MLRRQNHIGRATQSIWTRCNHLNKLVIAVINIPPRKMGPEISEVLVLGATDLQGVPIYLMPEREVALGSQIF